MAPTEIAISGPFPLWPDEAGHWAPWEMASGPGVYLLTVEVRGVHRAFYVGEAAHIGSRLRQHLSDYLSGHYWLYKPAPLSEGKLEFAWKPPAGAESVLHRLTEHHQALRAMLPLVHVFVCPVKREQSERRRIESALIAVLRKNEEARAFLENERLSVFTQSGHVRVAVAGFEQVFGLLEVLEA